MTNRKDGIGAADKDEDNDLASMRIESGFGAAKVIVDRYRTKGLTKISCDPSVLISVNPVNVQNVHQDVVDGVQSGVFDDRASRDSDHQLVVSRCASAKEAIVSGRETKQVIIVTGESNSGKTTLCASLIDALLPPDRDSDSRDHHVTRGQEIKKQGSLLGMFASASTVLNTSSTRLVCKTTMSLDDKGNVSRILYDLDCVELTRVVVRRTGQTNFFPLEALGRYLIAHTTRGQSGGSDDDSDTLKIPRKWLSPPSDRPWTFRILANSHSTATGGRALPSWEAIRQQLGDIGLSRDDTDALQARLVTILVLGNVDSEKGLVERIEDILEWWGNSDTKARQGFQDLKAKLKTHQGTALWAWFRDGMCMSIYGMCLRKLVKYMNDKNAAHLMMPGDLRLGVGSIVVLDTPGMECFQENLLDQMLFNSMNSILQAMLLDQLSFTSLPDPDSRTSSSFEIFSTQLLSSLTQCSQSDGCDPLLSLAQNHPDHFRIDPNNPLSLDVYHDNRWIRYQTELVPQQNRGGPGGEMRDALEGIVKAGDNDWLISPASSSPAPGSRVVTELGHVKTKVRDGQNLSKVVEKYEHRLKKEISDPHTGVTWIYCFNLNPSRQDQDLSKDARARGRGIDEQDLRIKLDSSGLISVIRDINEKWPVKMNLRTLIDSFEDWIPSDKNRSNEDRVGGEEQSTTSRLERFLDRLTGSAQRSTLASQSKSDDVDAQSDHHKQHYRIRGHGTSAQIYLDAHLGGLVQKLEAPSTAQAEVVSIPSIVERKTKNPFRTVQAAATTMSTAASSETEGLLGCGFGGMRVAADAMQRAEEAADGKGRSMVEEKEKTISSLESEVGKLKLDIEAKEKDIEAKKQHIEAKDDTIKVLNDQKRKMEEQAKKMETQIETLNKKVEQLQADMAKGQKDMEDQRKRLEKQHKDMAALSAAKMEEQAKTMENERQRWEHQSKGKNDKIKELHGQLDKWVSVYLKSMAYIPPMSSISVSQANATKHDNVGPGGEGARRGGIAGGGGSENGDPLLATVASYINNALASFDACSQDDDVDYGPAFDKAFDGLLNTVRVIAEDKGSLAVDRLLPLANLLDLLIGLVPSATASDINESDEHKNNQDANSMEGEDIENSVEYRLKACRRQLFLVIPDRLSSQLSRAVHGTRSVTPRIIVPALDAALMACAFLRPRATDSTTGDDEYHQLLNVMAAWVDDLVATARLGLPDPQDSQGGSETSSAYTSDMSGIDWKAISMPDVVEWYTSLFRVGGEGEKDRVVV